MRLLPTGARTGCGGYHILALGKAPERAGFWRGLFLSLVNYDDEVNDHLPLPGYIECDGLAISSPIYEMLVNEALPGSGIEPLTFWRCLSTLVNEFSVQNAELLEHRAELQARIDTWHKQRRGKPHHHDQYRAFLEQIGYLLPDIPDFAIDTQNVDPELAWVAGPQLVVPATNSRYVLNATNARWASLYDCLYGTDALGDPPARGAFDPVQGQKVIDWGRDFLDDAVALASGSHRNVEQYRVVKGNLEPPLAEPHKFVGYSGEPSEPNVVLLKNNGLHIEVHLDPKAPMGALDAASVSDLVIESAVTTIIDCEDSVATVDGQDKALVYRHWLGLMRGELSADVTKGAETFTRRLAPDRQYITGAGEPLTLPGRALLLNRNVGLLLKTSAVLDAEGNEVFEGLLDAAVTVLCAVHDLNKTASPRNSRCGSIYVVKPKLHGPREVAFASAVFERIEQLLGLPAQTVKIGVMDEERRTTVNLKQCIQEVADRIVFINTGFLDRSGDEIHTSMSAGVFPPKIAMKSQGWLNAYENWNVDVGLACGMPGHGQIGKGMWAMPDHMAAMLEEKITHPKAGASCAWVPSPSAATLHATHYHRVDVSERQVELADTGRRAHLDDILSIPVVDHRFTDAQVQGEIENNAQGILGYVVRWVNDGIGCSKVPDIDDVALMEDRATCRISSQHMANWLYHGVVDEERVIRTMKKMALVVDSQNADDPSYVAMGPDFDGLAFKAACELVLSGAQQPSGYTDPILHSFRREAKQRQT